MAKFKINGYDSYSGCDIIVTARINLINNTKKSLEEKIYTLGSLQTLSISTHQDKKPVRAIGSVNAIDYTMGQRTIAGSLVFAVFDKHFATEMFNDLTESTGKTFLLPDELPALDLTITFANEYGNESRMAIYGVRIINEGQVMSINDLYTENTYQFVATSLEPLRQGIEVGSSSEKNKNITITSSESKYDYSISTNGEDIYNSLSIENISNATRISLIASIEQPSYSDQLGIARLSLSPNQSSGIISIFDRRKDKTIKEINVIKTNKQYSVELEQGEYYAWYHLNEQTLSNTVYFNVNSVANMDYKIDDSPIIEKMTYNSIEALSNNPSHDIAVCIFNNSREIIVCDIVSRKFKFENLTSDCEYTIYTKNKDSTNSKSISVRTLKEEKQLLNMFKEYVKNNKKLLSKEFSVYSEILNKLDNDDFLYYLSKEKSQESKELIYIAVKYINETMAIINSDKIDLIPKKVLRNIYGTTFSFDSSTDKANIFINKNKKDFFESSANHPLEINYDTAKSNNIYNVVAISNEFIKSPKYTFYSFSDNDKEHIKNQFGKADVLNNLESKSWSNNKLSDISLKCLLAKENKVKDINILYTPYATIDESLNLIISTNYQEILGKNKSMYYLCICSLEESLDSTPIRKIEINTDDDFTIMSRLLTGINNKDVFAIWIEDEDYNIVSDLGFVSTLDCNDELNEYLINEQTTNILNKIEYNIKKPGYLFEILSSINNENTNIKNLYKDLALNIFNLKTDDYLELIYELFKNKFSSFYINKEKYKKAIYNSENNEIEFVDANDVELVQILIDKDEYEVNIYNSNKTRINKNYDINIVYLISKNPIIKSGFVLINSKDTLSYCVDLEVI